MNNDILLPNFDDMDPISAINRVTKSARAGNPQNSNEMNQSMGGGGRSRSSDHALMSRRSRAQHEPNVDEMYPIDEFQLQPTPAHRREMMRRDAMEAEPPQLPHAQSLEGRRGPQHSQHHMPTHHSVTFGHNTTLGRSSANGYSAATSVRAHSDQSVRHNSRSQSYHPQRLDRTRDDPSARQRSYSSHPHRRLPMPALSK